MECFKPFKKVLYFMKQLGIIFRKLFFFSECYILTLKSLFQIRLYIFEKAFVFLP